MATTRMNTQSANVLHAVLALMVFVLAFYHPRAAAQSSAAQNSSRSSSASISPEDYELFLQTVDNVDPSAELPELVGEDLYLVRQKMERTNAGGVRAFVLTRGTPLDRFACARNPSSQQSGYVCRIKRVAASDARIVVAAVELKSQDIESVVSRMGLALETSVDLPFRRRLNCYRDIAGGTQELQDDFLCSVTEYYSPQVKRGPRGPLVITQTSSYRD